MQPFKTNEQLAIAATPAAPSEHSTDLVPINYDLPGYNAMPHVEDGQVFYTNLEYHRDDLTADEAAAINNTYDIELNFGIHGMAGPEVHDKPTQREYEATKRVLDGLEPGDTLFLEVFGFVSQPPTPAVDKQMRESVTVAQSARPGSKPSVWSPAEWAEQERSEYKIDAWMYAAQLAREKGIDVVYADASAFMAEKMQAAAGKSTYGLTVSKDPKEWPIAANMHALRDRLSRNVVKDHARNNLPSHQYQPPGSRKPKLAVLFGTDYHKASAVEAYKALHLNVRVNELERSTVTERSLEHLGFLSLREGALPKPL